MPSDRRAAVSLACVAVLHGINHSYSIILGPLNEELRAYFGTDAISAITSLTTTYLAVYAASNLLFGFLSRRFSARRLLVFGALLNAAAVASFARVGPAHIRYMHLLWAVAGIGGGVYHPVANALVTRLYSDRKGWALGITGIGASMGFTFGPALTGLLSKTLGWTWQEICAAVALLGVLSAAAALSLIGDLPPLDDTETQAGREASSGETGVGPPVALLAAMLAPVVLAAGLREVSTWSVKDLSDFYLTKAFAGRVETAWYLFLLFLPGIVIQPLAGAVSDRVGRRALATAALALHAFGTVLIGLVPQHLLFLSFLVLGVGQAASVPTIEAIVADHTTARNRGVVFGFLVTAGLGMGALGPLLTGLLVDGLGKTLFAYRLSLFLLFCATMLGAVVLLVSGLWARRLRGVSDGRYVGGDCS